MIPAEGRPAVGCADVCVPTDVRPRKRRPGPVAGAALAGCVNDGCFRQRPRRSRDGSILDSCLSVPGRLLPQSRGADCIRRLRRARTPRSAEVDTSTGGGLHDSAARTGHARRADDRRHTTRAPDGHSPDWAYQSPCLPSVGRLVGRLQAYLEFSGPRLHATRRPAQLQCHDPSGCVVTCELLQTLVLCRRPSLAAVCGLLAHGATFLRHRLQRDSRHQLSDSPEPPESAPTWCDTVTAQAPTCKTAPITA